LTPSGYQDDLSFGWLTQFLRLREQWRCRSHVYVPLDGRIGSRQHAETFSVPTSKPIAPVGSLLFSRNLPFERLQSAASTRDRQRPKSDRDLEAAELRFFTNRIRVEVLVDGLDDLAVELVRSERGHRPLVEVDFERASDPFLDGLKHALERVPRTIRI